MFFQECILKSCHKIKVRLNSKRHILATFIEFHFNHNEWTTQALHRCKVHKEIKVRCNNFVVGWNRNCQSPCASLWARVEWPVQPKSLGLWPEREKMSEAVSKYKWDRKSWIVWTHELRGTSISELLLLSFSLPCLKINKSNFYEGGLLRVGFSRFCSGDQNRRRSFW